LFTGAMKTLLEYEKPALSRFPFLQKYCWTALLFFHKAERSQESMLETKGAPARQ
jgi:hypothetical protein